MSTVDQAWARVRHVHMCVPLRLTYPDLLALVEPPGAGGSCRPLLAGFTVTGFEGATQQELLWLRHVASRRVDVSEVRTQLNVLP
jgi:hypothetical protein